MVLRVLLLPQQVTVWTELEPVPQVPWAPGFFLLMPEDSHVDQEGYGSGLGSSSGRSGFAPKTAPLCPLSSLLTRKQEILEC